MKFLNPTTKGIYFLETVKFLAKYSLVLSTHLSDIRIYKKMTTTYLSPTIQNELILLLS